MTVEVVVAAGGALGAATGAYAARLLTDHYGHRGTVTVALSTVGAALGLGIGARLHPAALAIACLVLLAVALPLSAIDAVTRTLPDRMVLTALAACTVLLAVSAGGVGDYGPLWRALAAAVVVFLAFTALALAVSGGLGFGDCKAAALCALPLGYLGWTQVLHGVFAAFVFGALYVLACRLAGRTARAIAFGPFLFAGTVLVLLLA